MADNSRQPNMANNSTTDMPHHTSSGTIGIFVLFTSILMDISPS
jgi:hypothetical protein